jgi:hypothetical protein
MFFIRAHPGHPWARRLRANREATEFPEPLCLPTRCGLNGRRLDRAHVGRSRLEFAERTDVHRRPFAYPRAAAWKAAVRMYGPRPCWPQQLRVPRTLRTVPRALRHPPRCGLEGRGPDRLKLVLVCRQALLFDNRNVGHDV